MKKLFLSILAVFGLMLVMGSSAFASATSFYLNTDKTSGDPALDTIEVTVTLNSSKSATVTFTSDNASYPIYNAFLNVSGASSISNIMGSLPSGDYSYATGQGNSLGGAPMSYNVYSSTSPGSSTITFTLTATGSNSWASASSVVTPDGAGYDASADLQSLNNGTYEVAGIDSGADLAPEPSSMLLFGSGILLLVGVFRKKLGLGRAAA